MLEVSGRIGLTGPGSARHCAFLRQALAAAAGRFFWLVVTPLVLAFCFLKLWKYHVSVPFYYDNSDSIWQFTLTKLLLDTGWILTNPFMGAPGIAEWYNNPAAQASALHSLLMRIVGLAARNAVATQQYYYILNFSLVTITGYVACRLLGIRTMFGVCIGLLFAFLPVKFNLIAYAFLSNYFMIPLAVVPAIWILTGRFANRAESAAAPPAMPGGLSPGGLPAVAAARPFLISLPIMAATALTDGYYAFFTLLLLGVATLLRVIIGDIRRPLSLAAPLALIVALIGTALLLTAPLRAHQQQHPDEFAPGGIADPALQRHSFEAVVYSSSLMVLLAPSDQHRIPALARLGQHIVQTSNQARLYPTNQWAPLGTLGSLLFLVLLASVAVMLVGGVALSRRAGLDLPPPTQRLLGAIGVLSMFVMASAIFGGFGALIALIFPTIRAYDRFPIFLSFLLLCGGGVFLTAILEQCGPQTRRLIGAAVGVVTLLALFDQVPDDALLKGADKSAGFLADQRFVPQIEAALPDRAMVYQYPYSNYLTGNLYYGWGSFADMRFYLHSRHLRWSSGAAKNSPVDQWHQRLAQLSIEQRLTELQAAGFRGFLVDRTVVPDEEYGAIRRILVARTGRAPIEDAASRLAFWTLPDPGYRLIYGADFSDPVRLEMADPHGLVAAPLPRLVRRAALLPLLADAAAGAPLVIERAAHPEVFRDAAIADRGLGLAPITTAPSVTGDVSCPAPAATPLSISHDPLVLQVHNRSRFDWTLNSGGSFPLRIGMMELLDADGARLRWDGGFRVPGTRRIAEGESAELQVPLVGLDMHTGVAESATQVTAVFALVQDGNAWFDAATGNGVCRVVLTR